MSPLTARPDRLELQVARHGREVVILVNGRPRFQRVDDHEYIGYPAADLLDPDQAPLLPRHRPTRVAVYQCCCGIGGCGCVAPVISRTGDRVDWADFRSFTGRFDGPLADEVPHPDDGFRLALPDFSFDARHYLAEIRRAGAAAGRQR
jgi:hypothetical protein